MSLDDIVIGVPTCDRPQRLCALLTEIRAMHPALRIVVADDSSERGTSAVRGELAGLDHALAPIEHWTRVDRLAEADRLAGLAGVDPSLVRWAVAPERDGLVTPGAARNTLCLRAAGRRSLMLDDDTRPRASCLGPLEPMTWDSGGDPTELWFFPDRASATAAARHEAIDPIRCHAGVLGRELVRPDGGATAALTMTIAGVAGDAGMRSPLGYLAFAGESQQRLLSEAVLDGEALSTSIIRTSRRTTITAPSQCLAASLGLDLRRLLPPFCPIGRAEDVVFAATLRAVAPSAVSAFLPIAVIHDPDRPQTTTAHQAWDAIRGWRFADLVALLVGSVSLAADSTQARMGELGAALCRVATACTADRRALLLRCAAMQIAQQRAYFRAIAPGGHAAGAPGWHAARERLLEARVEAARDPDRLRDVPDEAFAPLLERFGRLLIVWPALWRAALPR